MHSYSRCVIRHVAVFSDLSTSSRAVPAYLQPLSQFLVEVGGALTSAALAAPEVVVSTQNPFESLFPKIQVRIAGQSQSPLRLRSPII